MSNKQSITKLKKKVKYILKYVKKIQPQFNSYLQKLSKTKYDIENINVR